MSETQKDYLAYKQSLEARNAWLDETLNPDGYLPQVKVDSEGSVSLVTDGGAVEMLPGWCEYYDPRYCTNDTGFAYITRINLSSTPGQGYGPATYLALMKSLRFGDGLKSGDSLTEDACKIWQCLESKGVATSNISDEDVIFDNDGATRNLKFKTVFVNDSHDKIVTGEHESLTTRPDEMKEVNKNRRIARALGRLRSHA